jgi:hypothetical protein
MLVRFVLCAAWAIATPALLYAQSMPEGYLCCNMRTDGSWISDSNYADGGVQLVPAGTPIKVTGYGRHRVHVDIGDRQQSIGNDYSRDIPLEAFAKRYVVAEDPRKKLASYPAQVRRAIESARLTTGMTRSQVLMSVGYPISSENPDINAKVLRFWRSSFAEFQVVFDGKDRVKEIITDPLTRNLVVLD